jgi:hypothetical protein
MTSKEKTHVLNREAHSNCCTPLNICKDLSDSRCTLKEAQSQSEAQDTLQMKLLMLKKEVIVVDMDVALLDIKTKVDSFNVCMK